VPPGGGHGQAGEGLIEGQAFEAKRIQELKKQNPDAGKAPKKHRNDDEER
jgi:hypothetical protein